MKKMFFCIAICVMASWAFAQSDFYEGDGGAGISIEVVKAEVKGKFSDEQEWFPDFAVNMIHDDMEKYSAIRMIDSANIEAQMEIDDRNLNSGVFEKTGELNYKAADNTLFVTLTVTPNGYNLSVRVNKGNKTRASYNESCSVADMNSGLAIKKATADLLGQLGVKLTKKGKDNLLAVESTSATDSIEAQKFNAKAQLAQQNGDNIAALVYILKAKSADSTLRRTNAVLSSLDVKISNGNIGNTARDQIQMRKDFIALLDEAENLFKGKYLIHYVLNGELNLKKINYKRELMPLSFKYSIIPDSDAMVIARSIKESFEKMPDHSNWGIESRVYRLDYCEPRWACFELVAKDGSVVARSLHRSGSFYYIEQKTWLYYNLPYSGECYFCVPANIDTAGLTVRLVKVFPDPPDSKEQYDLKALSEICQLGLYDAVNDKIVYSKDDARKYGQKIDDAFRGKVLADSAKNKCANLSLMTSESFFANYALELIPLSSRVNAFVIKDFYFKRPGQYYFMERNLKDYMDRLNTVCPDGRPSYEIYMAKLKGFEWAGLKLEQMQEAALKRFPEAILKREMFLLTAEELKVLTLHNDIGLPYVPNEVDERQQKLNELFSEIRVLKYRSSSEQETRKFQIYRVSEEGYNRLRKIDSKLPAFESCEVTKGFVKQLDKAIKKYYDFKVTFRHVPSCESGFRAGHDSNGNFAWVVREWVDHCETLEMKRVKEMYKDMYDNPTHIYMLTYDVPYAYALE